MVCAFRDRAGIREQVYGSPDAPSGRREAESRRAIYDSVHTCERSLGRGKVSARNAVAPHTILPPSMMIDTMRKRLQLAGNDHTLAKSQAASGVYARLRPCSHVQR